MKSNLHPTYYKDSKITCACGQVFNIGSTKESNSTETCSKCHPVYTGKADNLLVGADYAIKKYQDRMKKHEEAVASRGTNKTKAEKQKERTEKNNTNTETIKSTEPQISK